jgi:hypothetical protein
VLACIALFVVQYWASGWLQNALLDGGALEAVGGGSTWPLEDAALFASAAALWAAFDRSPQVCLRALTPCAGLLLSTCRVVK